MSSSSLPGPLGPVRELEPTKEANEAASPHLKPQNTPGLRENPKSSAQSGQTAVPNMSQRNRPPRDRARNSGHDNGEEVALWNEISEKATALNRLDIKFKENTQRILEMEGMWKKREQADGTKPHPDELQDLSELYRSNIKLNEDMQAVFAANDDLISKIGILKGLVTHNEEQAAQRASNSRDSHPRSGIDLDGVMDSPGPSPADNKPIRKLGAGRPSSQPPRDKEKDNSEAAEPTNNTGRTKITFALGAEVAFKPKIQNQTEEHDWIQGIVVKVIGEGKSRRYDVQDPFPEENSGGGQIYRSSASSMVPIPPTGAPLGSYEVGKAVLALYPETTTFYRAEVRGMVDNGTKVSLLFEDELNGVLKDVDRRFVLDHKG